MLFHLIQKCLCPQRETFSVQEAENAEGEDRLLDGIEREDLQLEYEPAAGEDTADPAG